MNGHKKRMNLTASGMAAMLSCLLLFSCNDEDFLADNGNITGNACDNICFGISPDRNIQTRGNAASGEDVKIEFMELPSKNKMEQHPDDYDDWFSERGCF